MPPCVASLIKDKFSECVFLCTNLHGSYKERQINVKLGGHGNGF